MSHTAGAEDYEAEETPEEDEIVARPGRGQALMTTKQYIEKVTGKHSSDDTDSDIQILEVVDKGKRKAEEDNEWSSDELNAYEAFKNRKKVARRKMAATKKKLQTKAKDAAEARKRALKNGESSEKTLREESEYEMDEDLPDYLQKRRQDFDRDRLTLHEAGLKLPPNYDDIDFSDDDRIEHLKERPNFSSTAELSRPYEDIVLPSGGRIPASIACYLRDYQVTGVEFLHRCFVYQKGGILGDDMGLGKTVQVVAFLTAAFGKTGDERDAKRMRKMRRADTKPWYPRVLIICPGSLIQNWKNELERWGWWHVDKFHGDARAKDEVFQAAKSGRLEIVITTYTTYKISMNFLNLIEWDCVVADECHLLKERSSATTKAMNEVNALCRIGLTGTAIQNKYEEMWTLLNWTNPGRLGPLSTWVSSIAEPLRIGQSHNATTRQLKIARETATRLRDNLLPNFFLRRMKSLIAHQLPKKRDTVVFCKLTEYQRDAYERFLDSEIVQIVKYATEYCSCGSGKKAGWCCKTHLPDSNTKWQALVFPLITTLQKLSNHLALLIPNSSDSHDKQQRNLDFLKEMVPDRWEELSKQRDSLFNLTDPDFCGKWRVLKDFLKFWHANGDKALIFSHSVRLLKMLRQLLQNTSYNVSFLSGEMSYEDRQNAMDDFNSDPRQFVFLISTKAGGVGLNITSANKVVIFDPNWNPSYDLQAQDRAYRIGQVRDVDVFRLVSAGTVEEIVYARQIYKIQQANIGYNASTERRYFQGVQNLKDQKGEIFGLQNLLSFHGDSILLRDIINKTNVAEAKLGVDLIEMDMEAAVDDADNPLLVDDDDGNGAMSQLAALLTEGDGAKTKPKSKPKTDPIAAILASAGVEYTHENSEVAGSSKVEAQLSRRAEEIGGEVGHGEEILFADSSRFVAPGKFKYQYHPSEDVLMRQFCTMAKTFGFDNATDFALQVESWTQKQRTNCLDNFYLKRKERLAELEAGDVEVGVESDIETESEDDEL